MDMKMKFHLPSFTTHFRFNVAFLAMLEHYPQFFHDNIEIASFYDAFPQSLWNGGRINNDECDSHFINVVINTLNRKGIPLRFTFTNPLIEEKHLGDKFCNSILERANNGLNEVIVFSPILEEYIRKNYPKYKITSSTCKRIKNIDALNEELEKDYKYVVLDYVFNNKFDLLEQVKHKEKCELLINALCVPDCPNRSKHYINIAKQQIALCEYYENPNRLPELTLDKILTPEEQKLTDCPHTDRSLYDIMDLPTFVKAEDIFDKYLPMGFCNFKLESRSTNAINLMEHYLYYLAKPEWRDKARYEFFKLLVNNEILHLD